MTSPDESDVDEVSIVHLAILGLLLSIICHFVIIIVCPCPTVLATRLADLSSLFVCFVLVAPNNAVPGASCQ